VVGVRDSKIKEFGSCNSSLYEEKQKSGKVPTLTKVLTECETGYGGCNDTLATLMFKELAINFTWSNETNHLRIDLEDIKEDLSKCRIANETLTRQLQTEKENWKGTKSGLDSRIYALQTDNGLVKELCSH
jgi:hypothetical protein